MEAPEVKYARSGESHIAYQVFGEGPDLVLTAGGWNHLLMRWELPANARLLRRLGRRFRVIAWDKRGTGVSDRHGAVPTLDAQMEDLRAVLDAAGSAHAAFLGITDGAALTALFAASAPERVSSAVLYGILPRFAPGNDGLGISPEFLSAIEEGGDPDRILELVAPSLTANPTVRDWWRRNAMMAASPGTVAQLTRIWMAVDLTDILPAVQVPTTVLQRTDDQVCSPANGRAAADLIPGARYVELPGESAHWSGDVNALADAIEEAVTGERGRPAISGVLASILFTDIVGSTERAAQLGDAGWASVLDEHDAFAARCIATTGGRIVKSLGDGMLAVFESPVRAVRCAGELVDGLAARGIKLRAGLHTGLCERRGDDIGGIAVHIAARVGDLAEPGEVLVTGTVRDLVFGSELSFEPRGVYELRGIPGAWPLLTLSP